MRSILFILSIALLTSFTADESKTGCDRKKLEGFWYYPAAPASTMLRESNQAGENLGEIGVMVHYDIRWKNGCDHDLVVKAVYTDIDKITPASFKPHLFKVGETLSYRITAVYADSMKYTVTHRGKTTCEQTLYRVPEKWLKEK